MFFTMYHLREIKLHCYGQRPKSGNATDCLPTVNNDWLPSDTLSTDQSLLIMPSNFAQCSFHDITMNNFGHSPANVDNA
jgi:hypothetical protein